MNCIKPTLRVNLKKKKKFECYRNESEWCIFDALHIAQSGSSRYACFLGAYMQLQRQVCLHGAWPIDSDVTGWALGTCLFFLSNGRVRKHIHVRPLYIEVPMWWHFSHVHVNLVGPLPHLQSFQLCTSSPSLIRHGVPLPLPTAPSDTGSCRLACSQSSSTSLSW